MRLTHKGCNGTVTSKGHRFDGQQLIPLHSCSCGKEFDGPSMDLVWVKIEDK